MTTGRDPADVIARVLAIVPADERQLRRELEALRHDSWFLPPEGKHTTWSGLRDLLQCRFPLKPPEGWPMEISAIVRGKREPTDPQRCSRDGD